MDHIDVFFVAPGDLAQSMGFVGQPFHPDVQETVDRAIAQIVAAGRVAGALASDSSVGSYVEKGARFISNSYDPWVKSGAEGYLKTLNAAVG